ncbi:unnamed protein product [Effrenium voratum]|nr:unnamed protein product [Effrenium voratum]
MSSASPKVEMFGFWSDITLEKSASDLGPDVLKRLLPNQTVALILEHRQLSHAAKRIENILRSAEPPRAEPLCPMCAAGTMGLAGPGLASRQRIRSEFVQTATATGRLATAAGAAPLLCLEKAFEICEVSRPSLHEELSKGTQVAAGTRVFVSAAFEPPPRRRLREGAIHEVSERTCDQPMANSEEDVSLADYWASRGWEVYKEESWRRSVQQVLVRHGNSVWSYPADQVWRLAAAVDVAEEDARKVLVNPRQLLAAEPGYVLLSLDYSQIEVRLMAHFSEDPRLLNILRNGGDVFKQIAAGWLGKDSSQVSAEERSGAKRICYSLIYGVGVARLAAELGISRSQGSYFQPRKEYAGVAIWIKACTDQARQQGFVETLHGRRRFLPGLASGSASERAHAERQAVNTACQASAADLMKAAMIGIHRRLKLLRSHDGRCTMAGRILLQIHDELILEVEELRLSEVRELVVSEMIRAGCLGNVSWHRDEALEEDDPDIYEDAEEEPTNWILQDADEDDAVSNGDEAHEGSAQTQSEAWDLPSLMKSRRKVGLERIAEDKGGARQVSLQEVSTAGEAEDQVGDLDMLLAECRRMGADMCDFPH